MQEPPKSFTEWFDGIGVVPKVWCSPRLGSFFAMVFGGWSCQTWNRKERSQKCWKLNAMTFFQPKLSILIHFWENTCLFCNPICLARHPRRWNLVWSPSLQQVWCFLICLDVDVCCKLFPWLLVLLAWGWCFSLLDILRVGPQTNQFTTKQKAMPASCWCDQRVSP